MMGIIVTYKIAETQAKTDLQTTIERFLIWPIFTVAIFFLGAYREQGVSIELLIMFQGLQI